MNRRKFLQALSLLPFVRVRLPNIAAPVESLPTSLMFHGFPVVVSDIGSFAHPILDLGTESEGLRFASLSNGGLLTAMNPTPEQDYGTAEAYWEGVGKSLRRQIAVRGYPLIVATLLVTDEAARLLVLLIENGPDNPNMYGTLMYNGRPIKWVHDLSEPTK